MNISTINNEAVVPCLSAFGIAKNAGTSHSLLDAIFGESGRTRVVPGQLSRGTVTGCRQSRQCTEPNALVGTSRSNRRPQPVKRRKASERDGNDGTAKQNGIAAPPTPANRPPASLDLGPNLLGAYRLLDAAGSWFEQLAGEFVNLLAGIGKASDFSFVGKPLEVLDGAFSGGDD